MASRTPRFTRRTQLQTGITNAAAGAPGEVLANELESFTERRQNELDRNAAQSGFEAGQQPGAEFDEGGNTIRSRAFNAGVLASQQAAQQTDLRDNINRFELEDDSDPDVFDAKVDGLLNGLLEESDARLHPFIRQRAADYAGRAKSRILGRQQDELLKQATIDLQRGTEGMFEDATTAAFEGDVPMIETRRQELRTLLGTGIEGELITEGDASEIFDEFERKVTAQEVIGNFDRRIRSEGVDAGVKAIKSWQALKPSSIGLTAEDHAAVTRQLVTLRHRQASLESDAASKNNAQLRAETNERRGRVTESISVLSDGFPLDKDQASQVAEDIAFLTTSGEADDLQRAAELAGDFDVANAIQDQVHQFRRMNAAARSDEIIRLEKDLRSGGASADEVALLDAIKKTDADVTNALDTDPRGYLQTEGLTEDPPLDFSGVEELANSIAARDVDAGSQLAGQPVGKLTAAEADQFALIYQQAEVEEQVELLGILTAGAAENAEATLEQIDAKGYKDMALLGNYVMQGRAVLARDILRGQRILASDKGIKPKRDKYQGEVDDAWAGAMSNPLVPELSEQRAVMLDAAFAKYAELKARTGDVSDLYDSVAMEDALNAVMPTARFNGRQVALPPGTTEQRFEDWIDTWDATTFAGVAGPEGEDMLDLVHDDGVLVEVGNGRYGVEVVSAATGRGRLLVEEPVLVLETPQFNKVFTLQFPRPVE